jgi:hypothetical protein
MTIIPTYEHKTPLKPNNLPYKVKTARQLATKPAKTPIGIDHLHEYSI